MAFLSRNKCSLYTHLPAPNSALLAALLLLGLMISVYGVIFIVRRPPQVVCGSVEVTSGLAPTPLQYLGNKFAEERKKGHARNVWDLQAYEGKIYLGGGSTTENAGPIHVWAYDPASGRFHNEYTVQEEAIELYRVFGDHLYIPAADPTRGDTHKFYRYANRIWTQVNGGPDLAHVRDLYWHNGKLVGVGNSRQPRLHSGAIVSLDGGTTLQAATDPAGLAWPDNWFYALFEYQGILFAPNLRFTPARDALSILTFDNATNQFKLNPAYSTADFLPVTGDPAYQKATMRLWLPVEYEGTLVYPAKSYCANKQCYQALYLRSYGLFVKSSLTSLPARVTFPDEAAIGEDVLVRDGVLYALANRRTVADNFVIYVYRTTQPAATGSQVWQEVLHFTCTNKARSFELLDNRPKDAANRKGFLTFYFGLGHEPHEPVGNSGALLKVSINRDN